MAIYRTINGLNCGNLLQFLLITPSFLKSVSAATCTDALLDSGYPTCFEDCASICELYCPDVSNTTCECTTPAYATAIFDCVRKDCDASDYKLTENLAILGCNELGINVAPQLSAMDASVSATAVGATATSFPTSFATEGSGYGTATTTATGTTAASVYYPTAEKSKPTITTSGIIGIIIGALTVLSAIGSAIWLVWAIQKRKAHANPNRGHGAVSMVAPRQPAPDSTLKLEPIVQYIPQPGSDIYPTAVSQTLSDMYPTVVDNGHLHLQQVPMQYQQSPSIQRTVSPLQQQPPFNPYPATELPNSYPPPELSSSYQVAELPQTIPQPYVELPAGYNKS
jgi:hypothetical protein